MPNTQPLYPELYGESYCENDCKPKAENYDHSHLHKKKIKQYEIIQTTNMHNTYPQSCGPTPFVPALAGDVVGSLTENRVVSLGGIKLPQICGEKGQVLAVGNYGYEFRSLTTAGTIKEEQGSGITVSPDGVIGINTATLIDTHDLLTETKAATLYLPLTGGTVSGDVILNDGLQLSTLSGVGTELLTVSASGVVTRSPFSAVEGVGENNTAVNAGAGIGIFKIKTGPVIELKSLSGGSKITVTGTENEVQIATTAEINDGINLGTGQGLYTTKSGETLQFKSIVAGTNITLTAGATELQIATTAQNNTASNLGAGQGLFSTKTASDLQFKSLVAGSNISLTSDANTVTINSTGSGTAFTVVDTSTADLTLNGSDELSVVVPMRAEGSAVAVPAGSSPLGYNFVSGDASITITSPTAGNINFSAAQRPLKYDGISNESTVTGAVTYTAGTTDQVKFQNQTLTGNLVITLSNTNATAGDFFEIPTFGLTLSGFTLTVTASSGPLSITPLTLSSSSSYKIAFDGTEWRQVA
jgi:hypothetical protein